MPDKNWQFELEEYIRQGEPERAEKSESWQTAIGLQAVDGLKTSEYLLDTAKDHIEGKITIDEAQKRIHSYYEQRSTRTEIENETKEADIVSARITKLLGEKAFQFSPAEWITIHRRLFEGVFDHAGQIRKYNISKKEWILNGETVIYADFNSIKETLDYDFATEKQFSYEGLSVEASVKHLAKFASDIWQIHPFGEGNTRATAVFMLQLIELLVTRIPLVCAVAYKNADVELWEFCIKLKQKIFQISLKQQKMLKFVVVILFLKTTQLTNNIKLSWRQFFRPPILIRQKQELLKSNTNKKTIDTLIFLETSSSSMKKSANCPIHS